MNAANTTLLGGGGIDGAIHRAGGQNLVIECRKLNGCEEGETKRSAGHNLPCRHILHTVGPNYSFSHPDRSQDLLRKCYSSVLREAVLCGARSVCFCCLSTGIFRYPNEDAAVVAVSTVRKW